MSDEPKHIRSVTAIFPRRVTFIDGVYEMQPSPDPAERKHIVLPSDYEEGGEVWVRIRKFVDLGVANGWGQQQPEIVAECAKLEHVLESRSVARCSNEFRCEACGYRYRIDSD